MDSYASNAVDSGSLIFDRQSALEKVEGDEQLLDELAEMFLEDCPSLSSAIFAAVEAKDCTALTSAAHAMKGVVANFGSHASEELARQLESMGRQQDLTDAEPVCVKLQASLAGLQRELTALVRHEPPQPSR